jgi:hypothetical protein
VLPPSSGQWMSLARKDHDPFPPSTLIALLMEAARTSETSVDNYFTRQYIPENKSELHTRRRENLKSHMLKQCQSMWYPAYSYWPLWFKRLTQVVEILNSSITLHKGLCCHRTTLKNADKHYTSSRNGIRCRSVSVSRPHAVLLGMLKWRGKNRDR